MNKKFLITGIVVGLLVLATVIGVALKRDSWQAPSLAEAEALRLELERVTAYELENGCVEEWRGQQVFCGESKRKVDELHERYQQASNPQNATQSQ